MEIKVAPKSDAAEVVKPFVERSQCVFSCRERICQLLDKAGVPSDDRWRNMILFMRSMHDHHFLSNQQKKAFQLNLLNIVQEKEYSDKKLKELERRNKKILYAPYVKKLDDAIRESTSLLLEFQGLLRKKRGEVGRLETSTISWLETGKDPKEIVGELRAAFREVISSMEQDVARLDRLSKTDGLTGLANRRSFDDELLARVKASMTGAGQLCLLMLDVDHFKKFNDIHGHRIGDQALVSVAKVMRENLVELQETAADGYLPARYGGEEFAVILPNTGVRSALGVAELIRKKIESYNFIIRDGNGEISKRGIKITVSVGVAPLDVNGCSDVAKLIEIFVRQADAALYAAKQQGRNRVRVYGIDISDRKKG